MDEVNPRGHAVALVGESVDTIDTPALVIDLDAMERNLHRMATFARERGIKLRPHAKMHKCAELARLQVAAGAVGVCVQKTAEATALAAAGVDDIYISNEVIDVRKLARVAALAIELNNRGGRLAIAVDSALGVTRLAEAMRAAVASAAASVSTSTGAIRGAGTDAALSANASGTPSLIDLFIEVDVGGGRCGSDAAGAAQLATLIAQHAPALRFAGLQAYNGRAQHLRQPAERRAAIERAAALAREALDTIEAAGHAVPLVTGAGTGSFMHEASSGLWGELQVGSYLFMDADYARNQSDAGEPPFEHALFVKSQVISARATHVVCDAGHKSHALDSGLPTVYGRDLAFTSGGDEHGILTRLRSGTPLPELGDTVWLIPGHCEPTVNLHDVMVGVRGGLQQGRVERIFTVDARGALG